MPQFGELLEKLAKAAGLPQGDILALKQKGNNLEVAENAVQNWMAPGQIDPYFSNFYAEQGEFAVLPLEMAHTGTNVAQTIPNNSGTILKPGDSPSATGRTFAHGLEFSPTGGSIDLGAFDSPSVFLLWAYAAWVDNVTGERVMSLHDADTGDPGDALVRMHKVQGVDSDINTGVYIWRNAGGSGDNVRIGVHQNSGDDLNVIFWRFAAIRIH